MIKKVHITAKNGHWQIGGGRKPNGMKTMAHMDAEEWIKDRCTLCGSIIRIYPGSINFCKNSTGYCPKWHI